MYIYTISMELKDKIMYIYIELKDRRDYIFRSYSSIFSHIVPHWFYLWATQSGVYGAEIHLIIYQKRSYTLSFGCGGEINTYAEIIARWGLLKFSIGRVVSSLHVLGDSRCSGLDQW